MKIVVIGGTGLIGSKTVQGLRDRGHDVVAAAPSSGVNTLTGEGLADALAGAEVVIDVANSPSFEAKEALAFFETAGRNLLAAEAAANVRHHLALSVVGTDRLSDSGYFRAKQAQEKLIRKAPIPFTILHSTQFFEFIRSIINAGADGEVVRLSPAFIQPVASDDVANALVDLALGRPLNGMIEIAGPKRYEIDVLAREVLAADGDNRKVIADPNAQYFGATLQAETLTPGDHPRLGATHFETWLRTSLVRA
ncbi:SDR family oxidoreductase [Hyphomonas johnsonii]|uniref:NAD(P)-binding domain-containing protein n=1 Tax=Hyphomonas johnsonii MHS-2 TaxID=1280950 RepID=A0A059FTV4_9PROT|nr:SDR family oxidoreductase [Hyphomonas johnsonii]KCZ94084.1 hypothetical protein HJO_01875 [Hyphomonas johnsonii MHS-2]